MAKKLEKMVSIDAQLRLLAPAKVSEADRLVEYDELLLDRFLDILQDLHGEDLRETVQDRYELSAEYEGNKNPKKLDELGNVLTSLDPRDSIVVAKAFSHMLSLANLAEEVQMLENSFQRKLSILKHGRTPVVIKPKRRAPVSFGGRSGIAVAQKTQRSRSVSFSPDRVRVRGCSPAFNLLLPNLRAPTQETSFSTPSPMVTKLYPKSSTTPGDFGKLAHSGNQCHI